MSEDSTLHDALQIIYQAYDRIYAIASHRWRASGYYDADTHTSDLFGHYVRSLPRFADTSPTFITDAQYAEYAEPFITAFNAVLAEILPPNLKAIDIGAICRGDVSLFYQESAYARCIASFRLIERRYPRADHIDGAKPKKRRTSRRNNSHASRLTPHVSYRKPQHTVRWMPYKD
jgi:hypothetical protein